MSDTAKKQIQALIDRETLGWNTKNADLFLDMIHPDMAWPWPPKPRDHDPVQWKFVLGRFNAERWRQYLQAIFDNFDLVHNHRNTVKIEISPEEDAGFAVVAKNLEKGWACCVSDGDGGRGDLHRALRLRMESGKFLIHLRVMAERA